MSKPQKADDEAMLESTHLRLPRAILRRIDAICRERRTRDRPNRSAVIRELIVKGLEA